MLSIFFTDEVRIENHAKNGRSSKSLFMKHWWDSLSHKLNRGDFVLSSLGIMIVVRAKVNVIPHRMSTA